MVCKLIRFWAYGLFKNHKWLQSSCVCVWVCVHVPLKFRYHQMIFTCYSSEHSFIGGWMFSLAYVKCSKLKHIIWQKEKVTQWQRKNKNTEGIFIIILNNQGPPYQTHGLVHRCCCNKCLYFAMTMCLITFYHYTQDVKCVVLYISPQSQTTLIICSSLCEFECFSEYQDR